MQPIEYSCQPLPQHMPLSLIKEITCDFSDERILGSGAFGVVYKGIFKNGEVVAVKRLINSQVDLDDVLFEKEVKVLFGLRHKNIVQLKGYSAESSKECLPLPGATGREKSVFAEKRESRLLCFEYVPKGNLRQHISDPSCGLQWNQRYGIIRGICSGLEYLHRHNIAHMDLKPENILLDKDMVPKIADFGASRLIDPNKSLDITRNHIGTLGYMAPEHIYHGLTSRKADLFSLGIIILELMTGSKPEFPLPRSPVPEKVVRKCSYRLSNAVYSEQIRTCASIALDCVYLEEGARPVMSSIIKRLDEVDSKVSEKLNEVPYKTTINEVRPIQQEPSSSWSLVKTIGNVAIVIVLQLGLASSWSWVVLVTTLKVFTALVTFRWTGSVAARVTPLLPNPRRWSRFTLISGTGSIMAAVFAILNNSSAWSWVVTTKAVTPTTLLFAIGFMSRVLELPNEKIDIGSTTPPRVLLLMAIKAIVTTVLCVLTNPSIPWSWVVTTAVVIKISIALAAIGLVATILSKSSHLVRTTIFAIGAGQAVVRILLNPSSLLWSWVEIISSPLTLFAIGVMVVSILILRSHFRKWPFYTLFITIVAALVLLNQRILWPLVKDVTVGDNLAADFVLLDPGSSWSWLDALLALLILFTIIELTLPRDPYIPTICIVMALGLLIVVIVLFWAIWNEALLFSGEIEALILFFRDINFFWPRIIPSTKTMNHA